MWVERGWPRELCRGPLTSEVNVYIGIGTIVLILVIVLVVMMLRGRRV